MAAQMKKFLIFGALLSAFAAYAVVENPAVFTLPGVLNEVILNYSPRAVFASRALVGFGALPTCPGSGVSNDIPTSAMQWTTDAGWVVCDSAGWRPTRVSGQMVLDGGVQSVTLPGVLADAGCSNPNIFCTSSMNGTGSAPASVTQFTTTCLLVADGGSGTLNYTCE